MTPAVQAQRATVAAEARRWLGTPYHHAARVRGAGVDCAQLLAAVYGDAGVIPPSALATAAAGLSGYAPDWYLHQADDRFLDVLRRFAVPVAPPATRLAPGDIVVFRFGRAVAHSGIVVDVGHDGPVMVHAERGQGVVLEALHEGSPYTLRAAGTWIPVAWSTAPVGDR